MDTDSVVILRGRHRELAMAEHLHAQWSIEGVYWRLRDWLPDNAHAKPALEELLSETDIHAKV